jgi:hypothetical protein
VAHSITHNFKSTKQEIQVKLKLTLLFICLTFAFVTSGYAQTALTPKAQQKKDTVKPVTPASSTPTSDVFPLKADESNAVIQASLPVQQLIKKLNESWQEVLEAPIEKATEVVAKAQNISLRLRIAEMEFNKLKDQHRQAYGCQDCEYSEGAKSLQRLKPQLSQANKSQ